MSFIEDLLAIVIPKAHHYTCGYCGKPIHPWEDVCPFCDKGINWREDQRMKEPDWYSRIFERHTSYARWLEKQNLTKEQM